MTLETNTKITTDCGRVFDITEMEPIKNGFINASSNYTFTIYRTDTQEYVQRKSYYNPRMNHTSTNYELLSEAALIYYTESK